jgi:hypothetical protein
MKKKVDVKMLDSVLSAGAILEAKAKQGRPDLPPGHPALRAMASNNGLDESHRKVRKSKKVDADGNTKGSDVEQKLDVKEIIRIAEAVAGMSDNLGHSLKEIYDLTMEGVNLCAATPSLKVRFMRLNRMVSSFNSAMKDCCSPLVNMSKSFHRDENMKGDK